MPANESDEAAVTLLNLRSSASSSVRNPAESIVNGVRMVCSFFVCVLLRVRARRRLKRRPSRMDATFPCAARPYHGQSEECG